MDISSILSQYLSGENITPLQKDIISDVLSLHEKISIAPLIYGRVEPPSVSDVNQLCYKLEFENLDDYNGAELGIHFDLDTIGIDSPTLSILKSAQVAPHIKQS